MNFDKKEALKSFKQKAKKQEIYSRHQYLAYAFLRRMPYVVIERKINEDKFPVVGRNNFLNCLAVGALHEIYYLGKYEGYTLSFQEFLKEDELRQQIKDWIFEKYASVEEVAA